MKLFISLFSAISLLSFANSAHSNSTATAVKQSQQLHFSTIHGPLVVDDPLAIELIQSQAMQRLKNIMQYGVNEFVSPSRYPYTRFEHSLCVYQLLKMHGVSRVEQIAGLLHDISHTVFSHTTEPLFMGSFEGPNYQDTIHAQFLEKHGIGKILAKYGFTVNDVLPDQPQFIALEQNSPALCADRIEYIIHAGDMTEQLTPDDIKKIHDSLHFDGQNWYFTNTFIAEKFARVSLEQTLNNWGSANNILLANYICKAIKVLWDQGKISADDIHFDLNDHQLWQKLISSDIPEVKQLINKTLKLDHHFKVCTKEKSTTVLKTKFRGVNPLIKIDGKLYPLTEMSPSYQTDYNKTKEKINNGWYVEILDKDFPANQKENKKLKL